MALFNRRKQTNDVLPEEVRDYYQAEKRQRTGVAWVLALVTLLVTFLFAAALFFGGRWVYRAIFDNDDKQTTSQSQNKNTGDTNIDGADKTPSEAQNNSGGQTSSTSTSTPSPTPAPAPAPASTTPTSSQLVNTGPGDEE